jgi:hypothetical protein
MPAAEPFGKDLCVFKLCESRTPRIPINSAQVSYAGAAADRGPM